MLDYVLSKDNGKCKSLLMCSWKIFNKMKLSCESTSVLVSPKKVILSINCLMFWHYFKFQCDLCERFDLFLWLYIWMVGPSGQFGGYSYFISKILWFYDVWDLCNILNYCWYPDDDSWAVLTVTYIQTLPRHSVHMTTNVLPSLVQLAIKCLE